MGILLHPKIAQAVPTAATQLADLELNLFNVFAEKLFRQKAKLSNEELQTVMQKILGLASLPSCYNTLLFNMSDAAQHSVVLKILSSSRWGFITALRPASLRDFDVASVDPKSFQSPFLLHCWKVDTVFSCISSSA